MIRCNLSILLAERNLKISRVSTMTGISRTTLTSLANNYSQGIQFDTLNTICNFLNIKSDQLISYVPVDIKINTISLNDDLLNIDLVIIKNSRSFNCALTGSCYTNLCDGKLQHLDIYIELFDEKLNDNDEDIIKENLLLIESFKMLSVAFRNDIQDKIYSEILTNFDANILDDPLGFSFTWPDELISELN